MLGNIQLPPKTRGLTAIAGAMSLIAVLLIVQIWLLSAALNWLLAGNHYGALPAAIFSGSMFLVCLGLYLFVERIDSDSRDLSQDTAAASGHK
jgi:hypothetical protein